MAAARPMSLKTIAPRHTIALRSGIRAVCASRPGFVIMLLNPADDVPPEHAVRFENQDSDDTEQSDRQLQFGSDHIGAAKRLDHADGKAARNRAGGVVDPAQKRARKGIE